MRRARPAAAEVLHWMEGEVTAGEAPAVPADDRALTYGDGLFETILVIGGRPVWLAAHLSRFRRSARALGFPEPEALARQGSRAARALLAHAPRGRAALRLTWTRGSGAPGFAPDRSLRPRVIGRLAALAALPRDGVRALTYPDLHAGSLAAHKSCSALVYVEALRRARAAGVDEALLSDGEGGVAEASAANLFVVRDGAIVTPPTRLPLLPGVTRAWAISAARAARLAVHERAIAPEDLARADEAFLTGSLSGVVPLLTVDGRRVGRGRPGPLTRRLAAAFVNATDG